MELYLVGICWYSGDQGDFPNTSEFPSQCFDDYKEAEAAYSELAKRNSRWSFGFQEAYLVKAVPGQPFETLKGRTNP